MKYLSPNVNSESRHIVQLLKQLACNDHPVWLSKVNGQPYCVWKTRGDNFRQTSSLFQLKLILDNPCMISPRTLLVGIWRVFLQTLWNKLSQSVISYSKNQALKIGLFRIRDYLIDFESDDSVLQCRIIQKRPIWYFEVGQTYSCFSGPMQVLKYK